MGKKEENKLLISTLQTKLHYSDSLSLEILNGEAPNSCAVLDKKTSLVWKIARNRPSTNPYLELEALKLVPSHNKYVIKNTDYGELKVGNQNYFYLVFPFIKGISLRKLIIERKNLGKNFSHEEIIRIATDITQAIVLLDSLGIVHQDIKPDNIIIKEDGSSVLIDLGIALFIQDIPKNLKKLEGPYAYMSPEKLAVIGNGKFRQWSKLNYNSDLFSLGLILLEMATLKKVTGELEQNIGNLYKIYEIIPGLEIKDEIKKIITPFLLPSQYDRHNSVFNLLKINGVEKEKKIDPRFWLHTSSKTTSLLESYISENKFISNFGLLYKVEQVTSKKNIEEVIRRGKLIKNKGGLFGVDPGTYLQVYKEKYHRGTQYFSYNAVLDIGLILYPPNFAPKGYAENYTKNVIDDQLKVGTSILISPYLYLDRIESENTEANFRLWKIANSYCEKIKINKYYGLLISEGLINSKNELLELAQIVINQRYAENIYLRVESKRSGSRPMWDRNYLENLHSFIDYISKYFNILLAGSGIEGLGFLSTGVTEISTNPSFSQRKFALEDRLKDNPGGQEPDARYFAHQLLNEVKVRQEIEKNKKISSIPKLASIFTCKCKYCPKKDKDSLAKHYLIKMEEMFYFLTNKKTKQVIKKTFIDWVEQAYSNYELLDNNGVKFSSNSDGSFIPIWKQVFNK